MSIHQTPIKVPSRLVQIKREETMAQTEIEAAHEREIQSTIQMSHSMEEIFVVRKQLLLINTVFLDKNINYCH